MTSYKNDAIGTRAIHAGEEPNMKPGGTGDVSVPIHLASTFARPTVDIPDHGYEYSRHNNPTRSAAEKKLAALEDARYGLAFSSGLAAETVLILSLVRAGEHVIAFDDLYGGSRRLFTRVFENDHDISFSFVDAREAESIEAAIRDNTGLIWLETPTNPMMRLADIAAISAIGSRHGIPVVVDNTFASPWLQNPLALGATVVHHSTTKYINGHSDSVGGALMLNDASIFDKLRFNQNATGAILSPFDSYMIARGAKTLHVRMERHCSNALAVARMLEAHPQVKTVHYPGLESHPQHRLASRQMRGPGGMISFELDGSQKEARRVVENLRLFSLAESLGGVESLCEIPSLMTHTSVPEKERLRLGISDTLIRLSVGIEAIEDLLEDVDNALDKAS